MNRMNTKSASRRIISVVLAVIMIVALIPAAIIPASASEGEFEIWSGTENTWWTGTNFDILLHCPNFGATNSFAKADSYYLYAKSNITVGDGDGINSYSIGSGWDANGDEKDAIESAAGTKLYVMLSNSAYGGPYNYNVKNSAVLSLEFSQFDFTIKGPGALKNIGNNGETITVKNGTFTVDNASLLNLGTGRALYLQGGTTYLKNAIIYSKSNTGVVVKDNAVVALIDGGVYGTEGTMGIDNRSKITEIKGGTFYNLKNTGTIGSIKGGTFIYDADAETNFAQIKDSVDADAKVTFNGTNTYTVVSKGFKPETAENEILKLDAEGFYSAVENKDLTEGTYADKVPACAEGYIAEVNADTTYTVVADDAKTEGTFIGKIPQTGENVIIQINADATYTIVADDAKTEGTFTGKVPQVGENAIVMVNDDETYTVVKNADLAEGTYIGALPVAGENNIAKVNDDDTYTVVANTGLTEGTYKGKLPVVTEESIVRVDEENAYTVVANTGLTGGTYTGKEPNVAEGYKFTKDGDNYVVSAVCTHEKTKDVIIEEPGYYFSGLKNVVCEDCETVLEENVEIAPKNISDKFTDVGMDRFYTNAVAYCTDVDMVKGMEEDRFGVQDNMTRGALVTLLYRMEGQPEVDVEDTTFTDIAEDYYTAAIVWAQKNGIVDGIDKTTFAPKNKVTREQIATILYRFAQFKGENVEDFKADADLTPFVDTENVSEYAIEAMKWANGAKIITGNGDHLYPQDTATRAEVVVMLYRYMTVAYPEVA